MSHPRSPPGTIPGRTIPAGDFYHSLGLPKRSAGYPRYAFHKIGPTLKELSTRRWTWLPHMAWSRWTPGPTECDRMGHPCNTGGATICSHHRRGHPLFTHRRGHPLFTRLRPAQAGPPFVHKAAAGATPISPPPPIVCGGPVDRGQPSSKSCDTADDSDCLRTP